MEEDLIINDDTVMKSVPVTEYVKRIHPELLSMITEAYGDLDNYVRSLNGTFIITSRALINYLVKNYHHFSRNPFLDETAAICRCFHCISQLMPKEQKVMMYRLGLIDGKWRTYEEVAEIIGASRERVSVIERKLLSHMASCLH